MIEQKQANEQMSGVSVMPPGALPWWERPEYVFAPAYSLRANERALKLRQLRQSGRGGAKASDQTAS